jgi:hypothetical protein
MDARARARWMLAAFAAAVLIAAAVAAPALGAGYGKGLFTGKGSSQLDDDRPRTPVELKVKGSHVRVVRMVLVFECAADGTVLRLTVETRPFKVRGGEAGGRAFFTDKLPPLEGGRAVDVTIRLRLRERAISGTADATLFVDKLPCQDDLGFKAIKR